MCSALPVTYQSIYGRLKPYFCLVEYSKTCLKRPLKNRQNKDLYDKW